jgi:hypothetical protein
MLERFNPALRILCFALGALVIYQFSRLVLPRDGLARRSLAPIAISASLDTNSAASKTIPTEIAAGIERVRQSEVLGQIVRPLPMAVLGIAGPDVFLRGPNGQTGLVREGEELGGVKLLKIGTNRVLVEHENQTKELMLFSGFGSETLLPKEPPK